MLFTGGEAVPYARAAAFEERTGARVLQFYGSNETGALSRTTLRDSRDVRLRTAGRVIDSMQVRLFDDDGRDVTASGRGQPGCKGALVQRRLLRRRGGQPRSSSRADGWMLTGDVVEIDAHGVLRVVGRKADFIIRGGKNVSAPAVEEAVATHPAVALAAAVAMPDPVFGERVCVYAELQARDARSRWPSSSRICWRAASRWSTSRSASSSSTRCRARREARSRRARCAPTSRAGAAAGE